jgi:tetratricopeptide (TPR) repeat protein
MGALLVLLGHPEQALDPLRRAIASDRGLQAASTSLLLGRALYATGRYEPAWAVFSALLGPPVYYDRTDPELLLDAVRTLVALDRNLHEARPLLALYRERVPGADEAEVAYLERQLDELRARPRRPFHRSLSDAGSGGPADPGERPPVH